MNLLRCALVMLLGLSSSCAGRTPAPPSQQPSAPVKVKLRLASTRWAPFTDEAQGGIALDLVSRALSRAGYDAVTEIVAEGELTGALREGEFDGSAALWPSQEREAFLLYSKAYLENRLVLVGKQGSALGAESIADLKGKKLGIVAGYAYGPELEASRDPELVRAESVEESLRSLLRGGVDYVLADELVIHHLLEHYPQQLGGRIAIGSHAIVTRTLHLALQKSRPDAQQIIDRFNEAMLEMLRDGSYNDVLHVRWLRADLDGDGQPELVAGGAKLGKEPPTRYFDFSTATPAANGPGDRLEQAHFVVKGVSYDSWSAVPDEHKADTQELDEKPRTLRVELFEF